MRVRLLFGVALIAGSFSWAETRTTLSNPVSEAEIVDHYLSATHGQQLALRGVSMEVDINANVPKLNRHGKLHALRNISKLGQITYRALGFNGDNSVKKEVIARYLSAEIEAQSGPDVSITPEHYRFKLKQAKLSNGRLIYILNLTPRTKQVGLFKGQLWLDADSYLPVRESGRFVKTPSLFLKKMEFVREYAIQDGVSIPQHLQSTVDTRLFGTVELNVDFTNFAREAAVDEAALNTSGVLN